MCIEFLAPQEFKRHNDIRVDIQNGVHARACTGGSIAKDLYSVMQQLPVFIGGAHLRRRYASARRF